jgi:ATP-binding cassette subfamily C (CFTR/MRP) protein 4
VAGRTGAGKSSLVAILFRLVDVASGCVRVDGKDITTVGLRSLRKAITVIPQDPSLMEGTFRDNLDPFHEWSDDAICAAMKKASLNPALLRDRVAKGGINLSAGQRQLVCFARAALYSTPILIMDEPTSSCDLATDKLIQTMVRREFEAATVITVAHRLNTIIDCDRILIMDAGSAAEFGSPAALLRRPDGHLRKLVDSLGSAAASELTAKARE